MLPDFDVEEFPTPFLRCVAEYVLAWAYCLHAPRVRSLVALRPSEADKLPYRFRVRVGPGGEYKKGELVFVPHAMSIDPKKNVSGALSTAKRCCMSPRPQWPSSQQTQPQ